MLSHVEPCWTMLSHVEPCWAMLSHVKPCWAMLSHVEPQLLSSATGAFGAFGAFILAIPVGRETLAPPKWWILVAPVSARGGGWAVEDWSSAALGLSPAGAASLWGPLQHLFPGKRWYATRDEEPGCIGLGSGQKSGAELEMEGGTKKAGRSMAYGYLNYIWSYLIIVIVHANQDLLRNRLDQNIAPEPSRNHP